MMNMLILFVSCSLICICFSCPSGPGWRSSSAVPGKCYNVITTKKIWFDAESNCGKLASYSHLTSISSGFEMANIIAIVTDTPGILVCDQLWIGANDFDDQGHFIWSDNKQLNWNNWNPGQPDLSNQCVSSQARTTGKWKTEPCGTENCFICEHFDEVASSSTPGSSISTTPAQPTTSITIGPTCDLSKQQWDIVLLFDVSYPAVTNYNMLLNLFRQVAVTFSGSFTLGPTGGQFLLAEYSDSAKIQSNFDTFDHQSVLNRYINGVIGSAYANGSNSNLGFALQKINTDAIQAPASGYRPNVRHMVLFSAVQSPPDAANAAAVVQQFNNECVYTAGVASNGVDLSNIVSSPDFAIQLNSQADYATVVNWLTQKICSLPPCPRM